LANEEARRQYEALEKNIHARYESASNLDGIIADLADAIKQHLSLVSETENLVDNKSVFSMSQQARGCIGEILRFNLKNHELNEIPAIWVPVEERPNFTVLNKEKAQLDKHLL